MKKIKFLTVLILLASSYGCKQEGTFAGKGKYGLKFKQELVLPHGKPLREIFGGSSLQIIDTLLLVQHQYENPTYFWEVYSLNNLDHIKSILSRGRGPGEVLFAHYTGQHEKINDDNWMFFFDTNSSKFLKINLDESIRSGKDMVELVSTVSRDKFPYFAIDKDVFLYCNYNRDGGYMSLMKGDNSWKNPVMDKKYHRNITPDDYNKLIHSMYYNKKNNKVCVIPYYVDHIQIIDLEGNNDMILSTSDSDSWPTVRQQDFESTTVFYSNSRTTDDYIFALYTNKKISELGDTPEEVEIHVFNWDGDAVAKLRLEDPITSFAVDTKNKVLYGKNDMEQIYKYDISPALNFIR